MIQHIVPVITGFQNKKFRKQKNRKRETVMYGISVKKEIIKTAGLVREKMILQILSFVNFCTEIFQ